MTALLIILKSIAWATLIGLAIYVCLRGIEESDHEENEMCCEPDFDYETGLYVHDANCPGMTYEQWERR